MPLTDDDAVDAVLSQRAAPTASPATPTVSSDEAAVDTVLTDRKSQAKQNVTAATRMSPDQAAKVHKLARDAGIAPWAVEGNEEWVLQQLIARKNYDLLDKNPVLARVLANNPAFADTAFDDMANADKITKAWNAGGFPAASPVARKIADKQQQILDNTDRVMASPERGTFGELGDAFLRGAARGRVHKTLIAADLGLYSKDSADLAVQLREELRVAARRPMSEAVAAGLEEIKEAGKGTLGQALAAVARNPRAVIEVSAESLSASAPSLVASAAGAAIAGPFGTAGGAIIGSFAVEYASVLADVVGEAGTPEEISAILQDDTKMAAARKKAATRGVPIALFDGLTAGLAGRLLAGAKGTVSSVASRAGGELALQAAGGGAGEAVAGALTNEFNWGDVLLEAFAEIPSAISEVPSNYGTYRHLRALQTAEADANKILATMQHVMESVARRRDPVSFSAFFQEVAGDSTVFIDADKLAQVLTEAKVDIAQVLPTAAAQIAAGDTVAPGLEIPVAELVTGLAGTGVEEQIVQHLRTTPDAMTLSEARSEDVTKATEFFQKEAERIIGEETRSEVFRKEADMVKKHIVAQLGNAKAYSATVNDAMATLVGHAYTVLAERLKTTPREVWNAYRLSIGGVKGGRIAPLGNTLNVGLDVGAADRTEKINPKDVVKAIEDMGVTVLKSSPVESEYEHEGAMVKENTLVVDTDRQLTDDEMMRLAEATKQEAIPQRVDGKGKLYGPKAAEWGDFNPEFFKEHDGRAMSEVLNQSQITHDAHALVRENSTALIEEYFTKFGNVIDPDKVKRLFPAYAEDKSRANLVHEPSSELAKLIFTEALKRNNGAVVVFTAGGGGSGKSETLTAARGASDPLTYDSTLSSFASAVAKIDQALASGAPVRIVYANRPAEVAGAFALKRKRVVPLDVLARAHVGASDTLRALAEHYRDNPNVAIQVFNNTGDVAKISTGAIADVPTYEYASLYRRLHELANKALADGEISAEKYAALTVSTEDGGRDARSRGTVQQGQPRQNVAGLAARAGIVSGPVTGVHFSQEKRTTLVGSAFGTGMKGAERERLATAADPRIKQRIAFYVNTGNGITPEADVGGEAHTATLTNLYDADADALKLWRNAKGDLNAAESAVLDAGFAGYLSREFGNQGTAVLLGARAVQVKHVGNKADVSVPAVPAAEIPKMKAAAAALVRNRALPSGQLPVSSWEKVITAADPDTAALIDFTQFESGKSYYKDEIARQLWQGGQWYFSQLQAAVEKAPAKVFTTGTAVKQWLAANADKMGVKKDELTWTGIYDWLDTQAKEQVSKDTVLEFLKGNGVRVTEVMLDNGDVVGAEEIKHGLVKGKYRVELDAASTKERYVIIDLEQERVVTDSMDKEDTAAQLNELTETGSRAKYESYVLPGGENYKELLLTLPDVRNPAFEALRKEAIDIQIRAHQDGQRDLTPTEVARVEAIRAQLSTLKSHLQGGATQFKSSHFQGTPNILAHIRFNERTDADGKRVLFIEEVQSDWGQKGKKEGFRTRDWDEIDKELSHLGKQRTALLEEAAALPDNQMGKFRVLNAQAHNISEQMRSLRVEQDASLKATPSAPFVTDTKAWTGLALKRMIAYAVDNGFDKIAWTTGEQQAARYDLSKQVEVVEYGAPAPDGRRYIDVTLKTGEHLMGGVYSAAEIEDHLGKEVAKRISEDEARGELTGLDLKIGGEGMRGYYGQIVPQVARKLGAEVGTTEIVRPNAARRDEILAEIETEEGKPRKRTSRMQQPGFAITDKMRELVATTGLPLFATQEGGPKLGSFDPQNLEMRLLADANLTTFLHETAHFFLTVYADVASQPNAPQAVVDDMNVLLKWFGVQDIATWNAMSLEQQRPYHEQFAESFEQFLFSGKAPNIEMQSLFQRFASWLKKVYGSVKAFVATHAGAKLNPEVEAVMERMLATEQEIADANEQRNYEALFKSAAEAGMTDREFADYMALSEEQREDAEAMLRSRSLRDMKWLQSRRNKVIAELQADAKEKRDAMRDLVAKEQAATPLRRAMRWLKRGELTQDDGTEVKALEGHRLQISEVEALFPEGAIEGRPDIAKLGYGQYGMLAEVGQSPDVVAEMFGFTSGEALVRDLLAAPKFQDEVEAITDQRMLEEYGDLSSQEAVARAADEAIHNAARARMVATELAALARNVGSPAALAKAARTYAQQLIATKTSKTLKPWAFAAAEVRASKAALAALRKGDNETAAREKRTELANHAAAKEAYAAQAEVKKIIDRFKKIMGYSDKHSAITSRDMATVQAVRAILARVGVAEHKGEAATAYLELVDQYDPVTGQTLRETIKDIGAAKDWRDLKLADLRVLAENVDNLWDRAKSLREFVVGDKRMALEAAADEIMAVLTPHLPGEKLGAKNAVTEKEQRWLSYSGLKSVFARIELWANKIDNAPVVGPLSRYVVNTIKAAEGRYLAQRHTELVLLNERIAAIAPLLKPHLIEAPELGYTFGKGASRSGLAELIGALMHTGNTSNKQKLLLGRGWATVRQDGALDTTRWDRFIKRMQDEGVLTKAVYDFVQGNWDMFERIKPDMQQAHKAVFGKFFGEITAARFDTPFGSYAGGYVPALTDRDIVHDMDVKELDLETLGGISHSLPAPANGMTKERSNSYNKPLALDLTLLPLQLNKALLFVHMAAPVQQVQRLINNTVVKDALDQAFPGARKHMIMPWLARAATHRTSLQATEFGDTGNWWKRLRSNTGMARMMGNVVNTLQQYTGVITAAGVLEKPRHLMYAAPALLGIGDLRAQVKSMSPYMATRMDNELSAISANIHEILVNPSVYEKVDNWTRRNAYFMQQWADVHLSPVIWMAAYNSVKDAHPETSEQDARDYADGVIRRTQGATGATDISTFEAGTPFAQMFTQFFSWSLMQGQTIWGELAKNADSERSPLAKVGRASGIVLSMVLAQSIVAEAIALAFRGGPDDDDGDGQLIDDWLHQILIMGPVKFMVGMVPVAGKAITVVINKTNDKPYDDRISAAPAFSAIENASGAPASVYKALVEGGKPSKAIKDAAELASLFGIPAAPLVRPIGYTADVVSGHVEPTSGFDFARGIMTGVASPASKQ